jgi:hypothetical protein
MDLGVPTWDEDVKTKTGNAEFAGFGFKLKKWRSITKT